MKKFALIWGRLEELGLTVSMALMTIVTFVYVLLNNLYIPFFSLADFFADKSTFLAGIFDSIGEFVMELAQEMTWSVAVVKLCFTALIFFGASYGVRTAGHIGVDAFVKLFDLTTRRNISIVAAICCLIYIALMIVSSYSVVKIAFITNVYGEDLALFGIKTWHIVSIVLIGFILVFIRMFEILLRLLRKQQSDLGLADEAKDALHLTTE